MKPQKMLKLSLKKNAGAFLAMFITFLVLSIPLNASYAGKKVNFTGTWSINKDKSDLGEGRAFGIADKMTIQDDGKNLVVERVTTGRDGQQMTTTEKYTTDGKECKNMMRNREKISVATWSEDDKSLTITSKMTFEREGNTMEIKTTEVYTLSDDGKTLGIDYSSESQRGTTTRKLVYDKS